MLMPMLWNGNDDWFDNEFNAMDRAMNRLWGGNALAADTAAMKTDVIEEDKDYKLQADLPGFNKEDIHVDMTNGSLTISAKHSENNDKKDENGKYIRRERSYSSYKRSFQVDKNLKPEDISAKYENGVLTLVIPKKEALPEKEEPKQIEIQ